MIYAVIPTGNRPNEYKSVVDWCASKGITTVTIATSHEATGYATGIVVRDNTLNISRWWNLGIDIAYQAKAEHVFVLNDDIALPDDWALRIVEALDAGYSGASGERGTGHGLIQGYAFGLNGRQHIRADDKLVWWFGDDDIQKQCEQAGGFAIIPGMVVDNYYSNSSWVRFRQQIDMDRVYYTSKWGA